MLAFKTPQVYFATFQSTDFPKELYYCETDTELFIQRKQPDIISGYFRKLI